MPSGKSALSPRCTPQLVGEASVSYSRKRVQWLGFEPGDWLYLAAGIVMVAFVAMAIAFFGSNFQLRQQSRYAANPPATIRSTPIPNTRNSPLSSSKPKVYEG